MPRGTFARNHFPRDIKRKAYARSGGVCECHLIPWLDRAQGCGAKLGPGNTFFEHILPRKLHGDSSLSNCAVLSKTCWKEKTASYDLSMIAKSNRVRDKARGIRRIPARPLQGTIASGWRKRVDGTVERR